VWPLLVEVGDVDVEDTLELAATEDQEPIEASLRTLPTSVPRTRSRSAPGSVCG
jgi:hypothetical protein